MVNIKGETNVIADWLSRSVTSIDHKEVPLKEELVINALSETYMRDTMYYTSEFVKLTNIMNSDTCSQENIMKYSEHHRNHHMITVKDGHMFYNQDRLIPDPSKRKKIMEKAHDFHQGQSKTLARIHELFRWPAMSADVEKLFRNCEICK